MFLYSLLALAVVTALIFAAPLKAKVWATLAVVAAGALWASATAVGVLAGGHTVRLWATDVFLFGSDAGSMDPLSALFALIVSVGAVAAVLYSRGYEDIGADHIAGASAVELGAVLQDAAVFFDFVHGLKPPDNLR